LWLVKWLLLIPHYIILLFLWLAFWIVTVIAFFAILFTTRYPKGLFDFNVGVIRWSWGVSFYGYTALATDRYPPFTLADVPDYPARLDIDYPQQLNRWLPLVKWLLAVPQYILVGALVGSGYVVATSMQNGRAVTYSTPSLIGACILIAAIALLFTTRYPPGLFDLAVGINRWGYRLLVYVALITDRYPPFRLDQGSVDPEGPEQPSAVLEASQLKPPSSGVHRPCIGTCCREVVRDTPAICLTRQRLTRQSHEVQLPYLVTDLPRDAPHQTVEIVTACVPFNPHRSRLPRSDEGISSDAS
jgi:Domain of unknown function (DUF4389)